MSRPNILLMISHDLGCHFGAYGRAESKSENLNRLAARSLKLDRYFVTSPGCSQSRSSLVTGRYPHSNGQFGLAHLGWALQRDEVLLPAALKTAGYQTALVGVWHLHEWTLDAFDTTAADASVADSSPDAPAEVASDRAARWLADHAASVQPFYLHVGFFEVHRPFCGSDGAGRAAEEVRAGRFDLPPYLDPNPPARQEVAELEQSVGAVDAGVGRILAALEAAGLAENTLVVFTADHGLPFPRAKGTLYDPGIQVGFLAAWPGRIAPATSDSGLASNLDLMPTLLEAAGTEVPDRVQGRSFLGQLTGGGESRDAVFAEKTYHEHYDPMRAIRTDRFKYIRNFAQRPRLVLPTDILLSPTRKAMRDDEALWSHRPVEEFYDLDADPLEHNNLADDPDHRDTLADLRTRLDNWMHSTADPLLHGPIPRPPAADAPSPPRTSTAPTCYTETSAVRRAKPSASREPVRPPSPRKEPHPHSFFVQPTGVPIMKPTLATLSFCLLLVLAPARASAELQAGAAIVDVTPSKLPVLVNGGMRSRTADEVKTPVNARAIVLDDGRERLAIVVVDSCMIPRPLADEAKQLASQRTKIRPERMLIAATHTHTAPSCMGCLGTNADPTYVPYLREKLAEAIAAAEASLEPARAGWAVTDAADYTALRRWIRRPDRVADDPFGNPTVRANMHAGRNPDDVTGESGPEDPDLSLISFQSRDGRPIALLANFSMHYFGDRPLSADYFGLFAGALQDRLDKGGDGHPPFVAAMSHGCSGDIWRRDYKEPIPSREEDHTIESYAQAMAKLALDAYETIEYQEDADLAMAEARLHLKYRVPDKQRLEWARRIVEAMGDRLPETREEIYAREQVILHEWQSTDVVVQALRIGNIAIATTPTETYALTGLKLKLQSPLANTMVLDLTNGGDGYIPPPEQHLLGGYNTWPARSAGLEVEAEPKIAEAALQLLEKVAGRPRRAYRQTRGPAAEALLKASPAAYWRLDEFAAPRALDASGNNRDAFYEPGVVFFLAGPAPDEFCTGGEKNRAAHFAGGRLRSRVSGLSDEYSVSFWLWNGMPVDARPIAGWMFSRGRDHGLGPHGDHLGVGGSTHPGRLVFLHGDDKQGAEPVAGRSDIQRWTWNHVVLVRDGPSVRVYLNGNPKPEIEITSPADFPEPFEQLFFGGRSDDQCNWEGRLDEIAVFSRALSPKEIEQLGVGR